MSSIAMADLFAQNLSPDPFEEVSIRLFGQMLIETYLVQMMYVSGETAEPPAETTSIMEDIVRQQVIEMVCLRYMAVACAPCGG